MGVVVVPKYHVMTRPEESVRPLQGSRCKGTSVQEVSERSFTISRPIAIIRNNCKVVEMGHQDACEKYGWYSSFCPSGNPNVPEAGSLATIQRRARHLSPFNE